MIGYGTPERRPCHKCTSVPQTSENAVRRSAPPGGNVGSVNSRISMGTRGAGMTAAKTMARDYCNVVMIDASMPGPMTIADAQVRLRSGKLSAIDLVEQSLQAIDRDSGRLNAFVRVWADTARAAAREADVELRRRANRGPVHGIP